MTERLMKIEVNADDDFGPPTYGSPSSGFTEERSRRLKARRALGLRGEPRVFANIGRKHPDYGMTPEEHAEAKAKRATGADQ